MLSGEKKQCCYWQSEVVSGTWRERNVFRGNHSLFVLLIRSQLGHFTVDAEQLNKKRAGVKSICIAYENV